MLTVKRVLHLTCCALIWIGWGAAVATASGVGAESTLLSPNAQSERDSEGQANVSPEVWAKIGPQIERQMYAFNAEGQAHNREHDFSMAARQAGLDVNGLLCLKAVALNGAPLPEAAPEAQANRVEYRRGIVTEWFENKQEGLEQGFTIAQYPDGSDPSDLNLLVALDGAQAVKIAGDGQSAQITDEQGRDFGYGGLKAWDATGRELACAMHAISPSDTSAFSLQSSTFSPQPSAFLRIVCDARDAQFPVVIDPMLTAMEKKLMVANPTGLLNLKDNLFGCSVSVDGDVAVVGAWKASPGGINQAGAAYVFERNAGGTGAWGQVTTLMASDKSAANHFGCAVSVAGDVVLVGAFQKLVGVSAAAGGAYVFERNTGGTNAWGEVAVLTALDAGNSHHFGYSVSVAGDVALVGAKGHNKAYVFGRNAGGTNAWGQVKMLGPSGGGFGFGYAVSVAGDVALVGACFESTDTGEAYVFVRNIGGTNNWGEVKKLTASDKAAASFFGAAVSVAGDVAVVGAYGASPGGTSQAGAAYVFGRHAGGDNAWGEVKKLTALDKAASNQFGWSVSVAGDLALVGALQASPSGVSQAGAAYLFERNAAGTNAWGQVEKLTASDQAATNQFGSAVCVGGGMALIGAHKVDRPSGAMGSQADAGAAYLVPLKYELWAEKAKLMGFNKAANDQCGYSVSVAGDVMLVGAAMADPGQAGAAYLFERNAGGANAWGEVAKLTPSGYAMGDQFGYSVSVAGDVALVGAWHASPAGTSHGGAAYVFERNAWNGTAWGEVAKLTASDITADDEFGISVCVAGDVAIVGANRSNPEGLSDAGAAYVFERNAGGANTWGQVAKLTASDKAKNDQFGFSVSVAGDVALVGAWGANFGEGEGQKDDGAAYVFERNAGGADAWGEVAKLTASDEAENDRFGHSVWVAGDVALVGSVTADFAGKPNAGAAYLFERHFGGTNAWGEVAKLSAPENWTNAYFGSSVCLAGDVALVGAYGSSPGGITNAGAAYLFERNAGGANAWGEVAVLTASDKAVGNKLGFSVSVAGDVAVVGARFVSYGAATNVGAAYVWEGLVYGPVQAKMSVRGTNGAEVVSGEAASTAKGTDFGRITPGTKTHTFSITNAGVETLSISGWTTNGTGAAQFRVIGMPATVAAGAKATFQMAFAPTVYGVYTAAVVIANNTPTDSSYVIPLSGHCGPTTPFSFRAVALTNNVILRWPAPSDYGFASQVVHIRYSTADYPADPSAGTQVYQGTNQVYEHTGLTPGQPCYYTIWVSNDGTNFVVPQ